MKSKTIYISLAIVFAIFTVLQFNDPDPLIWILIYGSVSLISLLMVYLPQVRFGPLIVTLLVVMGLYSLAYIPGFIDYLGRPDKIDLIGKMKAEKPWIEDTREFLGLIIVISTLVYLRRSGKK